MNQYKQQECKIILDGTFIPISDPRDRTTSKNSIDRTIATV